MRGKKREKKTGREERRKDEERKERERKEIYSLSFSHLHGILSSRLD